MATVVRIHDTLESILPDPLTLLIYSYYIPDIRPHLIAAAEMAANDPPRNMYLDVLRAMPSIHLASGGLTRGPYGIRLYVLYVQTCEGDAYSSCFEKHGWLATNYHYGAVIGDLELVHMPFPDAGFKRHVPGFPAVQCLL